MRLAQRRGSPAVAFGAAMVAVALGVGSLLTLIVPATGAKSLAPSSALHAVCFVVLGLSIVAMQRGFYTLASAGTIGTLWLIGVVAQAALLNERVAAALLRGTDMHSLPSAVSIAALACAAAGCFVFLVGNGPLRPVRRACGLLLVLSGLLGMAGLDAFGAVVPGINGGVSIVTATALVALGVAVHEVERDVEVAHA